MSDEAKAPLTPKKFLTIVEVEGWNDYGAKSQARKQR